MNKAQTILIVEDDYKSNVYIVELVDTVRIMEHTDLYAANPISESWSKDSKRVYIEVSNENEAILETVAVFEVA